jgi:hypothetical protein
MSTFGSASTATRRVPLDPTKHVNYELGMVLGVDDFTQEFAYLSERDRWLARDVLGHGTVWGLAVTTGQGTKGPEVRVSPGVAVSPRGQLLRVTPAQCASINDWLAARTQAVTDHLSGSPPGTRLEVYVVLGYEYREADPVPIPGEPCRSESDAMKASRIADCFKLELSFDPPRQYEEGSVRDLVRWLRNHLQVGPGPGGPLNETDLRLFLKSLRDAVVGASSPPGTPISPPGSPPDFLLDNSPPVPTVVPAEHLGTFLREALRLWVTELRPLWRTHWLGETNSCVDPTPFAPPEAEDSVLLAALELPLTRELGGGPWKVASPAELRIDEDQRPFLAHLRLLQEFLLQGLRSDTPATSGVSVVAAGTVSPATPSSRTFNGLKIIATVPGGVTLTFNGYQNPADQPFQYVVKALLATSTLVNAPTVTLGGFQADGFVLNVSNAGTPVPLATMNQLQLIVEVSQFFTR